MVLAIQWVDGSPPGIRLLDQTRLPEQINSRLPSICMVLLTILT